MLIARVVGSAISTMKEDRLNWLKLLVVREATVDNQLVGKPIVAIDAVGAGEGELVLIAQGSSARQTRQTRDTPVDAVIMAILDSLEVEGKVTFRKA
ncbi:MAG: EutN/CcmL family microcompartment protein [Anaerolineae bacterium]|nr:EutN/CcmL family microcompartment protein [Anaerolineae bacterium]